MLSYLLQLLDVGELRWIKEQERSDKWSKKLDTWTHVHLMVSAQLTKAESLSSLSQLSGLTAEPVNKSSLSRVNTRHDRADIFKLLFTKLVIQAKKKHVPAGILSTVEDIDTSYMLVPLKLFSVWKYDDRHGAVKIGLKFSPGNALPTQLVITDGKIGDTKFLAKLKLKPSWTYLIDAGFRWYKQYDNLMDQGIHFIGRIQSNSHTDMLEEYELPPLDNGIYADQLVRLGSDRRDRMKHEVRLIRFIGKEGKDIWLVTTRFDLTAREIVLLYKQRWQIEIFFKTIKQYLKIKHFYGTTKAAVTIQLYAALIAYLIVWLLKKQSVSIRAAFRFVKFTLLQRFTDIELLAELHNNSIPIYLCNG